MLEQWNWPHRTHSRQITALDCPNRTDSSVLELVFRGVLAYRAQHQFRLVNLFLEVLLKKSKSAIFWFGIQYVFLENLSDQLMDPEAQNRDWRMWIRSDQIRILPFVTVWPTSKSHVHIRLWNGDDILFSHHLTSYESYDIILYIYIHMNTEYMFFHAGLWFSHPFQWTFNVQND